MTDFPSLSLDEVCDRLLSADKPIVISHTRPDGDTVGAAAADPVRVLHSACSVGAKMMGLFDCDCLAVGKQADLIMLDLHTPNMQPLNNIAKNVVYSGSKANVALTMVAGRILFERGTYTFNVDPEAVYAEANEIITRIRRSEGR